ncbi:adaptor protein MecA [Periweissella cryptocerci]|uniref:Adapter protein MecA n=1 Tax=Periweissella cryptocerci TaxID=2506420 RepID=A0A4P6YRJ6_9LACO|nr:adaptor protein MecA [Periweissella cryptocerci]QBO35267.1 adaptor protein MecA [Periweissella cryptocerci]
MEKERINENTIRVSLGREDLEERGISIIDLISKQDNIEAFFYDILEEVDTDHDFEENEQVTFQVMPNRGGLELFISKNVNTDSFEEMFQMGEQANHDEVADDVPADLLAQLQATDSDESAVYPDSTKQVEQFTDQRRTKIADDEDEVSAALANGETAKRRLVFKLADFEDFLAIAKELRLESGISNLFQYNGAYYLELVFFADEITDEQMKNDTAVVLEFAEVSEVSADVLAEHGTRIMENTALELARYYFK